MCFKCSLNSADKESGIVICYLYPYSVLPVVDFKNISWIMGDTSMGYTESRKLQREEKLK